MQTPEQIVANWLEMPAITAGMTELKALIDGIRAYGEACAAAERQKILAAIEPLYHGDACRAVIRALDNAT